MKGTQMTSRFKGLVAAVGVAGAFAAVPAQGAFLNNWFLDFDGAANPGGLTEITEILDVVGPSVVKTNVPNAMGQFTFTEFGAIRVFGHDGGAAFDPLSIGQIAALFDIAGNGVLSPAGGAVNYTGGAINVFFNPVVEFAGTDGTYGVNDPVTSTLIATFTPITGGGNIDPSGVPNGIQTITAAATFMAAGWFFSPDGSTDLTLSMGAPDPVLCAFATANASVTPAAANLISHQGLGALTQGLRGNSTAPCTGAGNFAISNNGQFRLAVVPEPGTIALLKVALLGLGVVSRRKV